MIGATVAGATRDRGHRDDAAGGMLRKGDRDDNRFFVPVPIYTGWGWWPWYGFGYNSLYGFGFYDPFGWYGYGFGYGGYADAVEPSTSERARTGSIRLKVKPGTATVYVDGALVGIAADFAGRSDHLDLPAGGYQLELRADGYETYQADILVSAGRTITERVTLKKK
jgi:hypothetical protein